MTDIIPAVLPHTLEQLATELAHLRGVAPIVQIDVVSDIFGDEESLPEWEEFDFEFDLYIDPASFVARAIELGASSVIVHARHATALAAVQALQEYREGGFAIRVGIALRPADEPSLLERFDGLYDFVQVMGIDHEGRQGEPFDPRAVELVLQLRQRNSNLYIQVDGHASGNERALAVAGANRLVEGSVLVRSSDPKAALKEAYTRANGSERFSS